MLAELAKAVRVWIFLESKANRIRGRSGLGRPAKSSAKSRLSWKCLVVTRVLSHRHKSAWSSVAKLGLRTGVILAEKVLSVSADSRGVSC